MKAVKTGFDRKRRGKAAAGIYFRAAAFPALCFLLSLCLILPLALTGCAGPDTDTEASSDTEISAPASVFDRDTYVYIINVGYGDAILIKINGAFFVIDTGASEHSDDLLRAYDMAGVDEIEAMFITHTHSDHVGGIKAAAEHVNVKRIYYPFYSELNKDGENKIAVRAAKNQIPSRALRAGDSISCGGVAFDILGPTAYCETDDNDNSLVIRAEIDGITYLFTGDMQFYEEALVMESGADLDCDVLKVGNHGNSDATSVEFLAACTPSVSVISTSRRERSGSASLRVRDALAAHGKFYITENFEFGVMLYFDGSELIIDNPY